VVREKKNERGKEHPLLAVGFTMVSTASFSTGVNYVKQRLLKPVWVLIHCAGGGRGSHGPEIQHQHPTAG
jgi:hypothetical protein